MPSVTRGTSLERESKTLSHTFKKINRLSLRTLLTAIPLVDLKLGLELIIILPPPFFAFRAFYMEIVRLKMFGVWFGEVYS